LGAVSVAVLALLADAALGIRAAATRRFESRLMILTRARALVLFASVPLARIVPVRAAAQGRFQELHARS